MDYGLHDPIYSHRVYSLQAVERPPQSLCYDDGKPGDDDGNPYTVILSAAKDLCVRRARPFPFAEFTLEQSEGLRAAAHALRVTGIISKCLSRGASLCWFGTSECQSDEIQYSSI